MIRFENVELYLGGRELLREVSLTLFPGQKVGLIGANGTGKTSLLRLIRGELHPDQGRVVVPAEWVIASADQSMPAGALSALDFVLQGDDDLIRLEVAIRGAEAVHDGVKLAGLYESWTAIHGQTARARAAELLDGLGFAPIEIHQPVDSFSGGWRMRLNLARAMFCRSDLLLLDEPTNHLDLETIQWLEGWIVRYPNTLILISHDREFLDRTIKGVIHIEHHLARWYSGNYSDFERQRMERLAQQESLYQKQQREVAHLHLFIDRFRAKASKARQAQDRMKKLERMELIAPAHVDSPFHFEFRQVGRAPNPLLQMDDLAFAYPGMTVPVVATDRLVLRPGDRIGLLGRNGAGKTTLVKLMAGLLAPTQGTVFRHDKIKVGYFAQQQIDLLDLTSTPYHHILRLRPEATEQSILNFLGGFGFNGERARDRVEPFSGGEKARLLLAMLVWSEPTLLLLDEPTNHLDLDMRHALTLGLQGFEGAVVLVSHDRFLLSSTVEEFYLVHDGRVAPYDGNLDDYAQFSTEENRRIRIGRERPEGLERPDEGGSASSRREQRQEAAQRRQALAPLRKKVAVIEARLAKAQSALAALEDALGDEALYAAENRDRLVEVLAQQGVLRQQIEADETDWLLTQAELDESLAGST